MKSYHFDCGDSNNGPIGFCARIDAESKAEAVKRLRELLEQNDNAVDVPLTDSPGGEYVTVYFNGLRVTEKDIDEVNDENGDEIDE